MIYYTRLKYWIDFFVSLLLIILTLPVTLLLFLICSISTKSNGIFVQKRIGYKNKSFCIYKFKTMHDVVGNSDTITNSNNLRITAFGRFLRKTKLDELPQLFNILFGQMSFVGPRPDVSGYAETLPTSRQYLLYVKPGITSPASLYFKEEEYILSKVKNKFHYNNEIIWPMKAELNYQYSISCSFLVDIKILMQTVGIFKYKIFKI